MLTQPVAALRPCGAGSQALPSRDAVRTALYGSKGTSDACPSSTSATRKAANGESVASAASLSPTGAGESSKELVRNG